MPSAPLLRENTAASLPLSVVALRVVSLPWAMWIFMFSCTSLLAARFAAQPSLIRKTV